MPAKGNDPKIDMKMRQKMKLTPPTHTHYDYKLVDG
jgi:hypothetical protein